MASESSVTDQSVDEPAEEKNVGDASKCVDGEEIIFQPKEAAEKGEEDESKEDRSAGMESKASISGEELEPADASVTDVTKKDEQHEKIGEVEDSLQESEVSNFSEPAVDTTEGNLQSQADDVLETPSEVQEKSSDFVEISTSQEPIISESETEDLKYTEIDPKSENERKPDEAPLFSTGLDISEDGNVKAEMPEAPNPESSNNKVEIKMIESEDFKNKIQLSVPAAIPTVVAPVVSDVPQKDDIDFGNPTSIEVPVKDLEVESGSPEEQKSKESTETLELNSNLSTIDAEDEVAGSSSYEVKPSEAAEVVEKKDDGLEEETIQISAKIQKDREAKNESAQTESNENISQGFEVKNDDEIVEGGIETSTVPDDIPSLAKVSSELERASEPGVVDEEEDTSLERGNIDTVPKVAEVSLESGNVSEGDKLVGNDKVVNAEALERDLVDTITDPTEAEVSSDQVKSPATTEIVNEALEVTSKELNNAPEASEAFFEGDRSPAVDEKSESLEGEAATSVEAPADTTAAEEPLDQVVEEMNEKSESLKGEAATSVEAPTDATAAEEPIDPVIEEKKEKSEGLKGEAATSVEAPTDATAAGEPLEEKDEKSEILNGEAQTSVEASTDTTTAKEQLDEVVDEKNEGRESLIGEAATSAEVPTDATAAEEPLDQVVEEKDDKSESLKGEAATSAEALIDTTAAEEPLDQVVEDKNEKSESLKGEAATSPEIPRDTTTAEEPLDQVVEEKKERSESLKGEAATSAEAPIDTTAAEEPLDQVVERNKEKSESLKVEAATSADTPADTTAAEELLDQVVGDKNEKNESLKTSLEEPTNTATAEEPLDQLIEEKNDKTESLKGEAATSVEAPTDATAAEESFDPVIEEKNDKSEGLKGKAATSVEAPTDVTAAGEPLEEKDEKSESLNGEAETSAEASTDITTAEEQLDEVVDEKDERRESLIGEAATSAEAPTGRDLIITDPRKAEVSSEQVIAPTTTEITNEALEVTSQELNIVPEASEVSTEIGKVSVGDEEKSKSLIVGESTSAEAPKDITAVKESLDPMFEEKIEIPVSDPAAPIEGKLVDQEKHVNVKDEEENFINTSTDAIAAEASSEQKKSPEIVESDKQALEETSKELSIAPEANEVPFEDDKISAGEEKSESLTVDATTSVEAPKDITTVEESLDQVIDKKNENSITEKKALPEDILVEKEKSLNEEAEEKDLVDTSTDTTAADVYSDQVKASETAEIIKEDSKTQASEVTSKELNITPEASDVHSDGDEVFASDEEKRESLKGEDSTLVEAPKDIKIVEESPDQVIKQKSESSKSEMEAQDKYKLVDKETDVNAEAEMTNLLDTSTDEVVAPTEDKFVDKEKNVYVEDEQRDLIETSTDTIAAEVSSEHEKAPEIAEKKTNKQALEETSKELDIAPEDSEAPAEDNKLSAGEEKSESLRVEAETLVETPKDITTVKELLGQVIEKKKSESSVSENKAPPEDKLVDKEKDVNAEAEEGELVDTFTDPTAAEVATDQLKASETAENIKEDSNKQALEVVSKELNITSEAIDIPSKCDEVSAGDEEKRESLKGEDAIVEASKDVTIAEELPDQVIKQKSESCKSLLVGKEKDVNADAEKTNLHDTSRDPTAGETAEITKEESNKQSSEVTSIPEACEVPSEGDKVSSGEEEKIESLKGEDATSLKVPEDIITPEKSIDQLIEENKSESSKNESEAPIETTRDLDTSMLFPEAVKDIIASEEVRVKQDEASNDLDVVENKASDSENRKEEVRVEGVLQNTTDKPEEEELGAEKSESEKSKDQGPIVSSDSVDAKPTKEVSKRESNIFSKVKRSIVKAKKAILRKPSSHNSSSVAKN